MTSGTQEQPPAQVTRARPMCSYETRWCTAISAAPTGWPHALEDGRTRIESSAPVERLAGSRAVSHADYCAATAPAAPAMAAAAAAATTATAAAATATASSPSLLPAQRWPRGHVTGRAGRLH